MIILKFVKYFERRMDFCVSVEGSTNFPKLQGRLNILGTRMVTQRKFHTEDPKILDTVSQHLFSRAI